jgi:hypothetical protein
MYFVCDASCDRTFIISDTEAGLRDFNRLLASLYAGVVNREQARELASLAVILIKRAHPEPKRTSVRESNRAFVVTLRYAGTRSVVSVNREDSTIKWMP